MMLDGAHYDRFDAEADHLLAEDRKHPLSHRLIVALDMPSADEAADLVAQLGDTVKYYKIGLELMFGGGLKLAETLIAQRKWVFLDMKLLDIGNTVKHAVANASRLGVNYLTVHGTDRKTLDAAYEGREQSGCKLGLLAVTVLTSLNAEDLRQQGIHEDPQALALRRAAMAFEAGFDGVIASGHEATSIRQATSKSFLIKTPGIRPSGSPIGDQSRVMTPSQAIAAGADYLVVGRPITQAADKRAVAKSILQEISTAMTPKRLR